MRPFDGGGVPTGGTLPGLRAYPDGDPEAIHALAADLRRAAGVLSGAREPGLPGWQSPEATRVRTLLRSAVGAAEGGAARLRGLASTLDGAAGDLEADQRAWRAAWLRHEQEQEAL